MENLVLKYESTAANWVDELQVPLTERIAMFEEIYVDFSRATKLDYFAEDLTLAKFLYCNFLFPDSVLDFVSEIESAKKPYQITFGRLDLIKDFNQISAQDAIFISEGFETDPAFRIIALAILTEFTRKSRLNLGMEMAKPINLGAFNILLAAMKLSTSELERHAFWTGRKLLAENLNEVTLCQMVSCKEAAAWLVVCPQEDGREYMCTEHKRQHDLDFSTYRLMFTNSCGHYADRRDCTFVRVSV